MISIIIPAYNSRATIVEALDSVSAQTIWADTELLVKSYSLLGAPAVPLSVNRYSLLGNSSNNQEPITNNCGTAATDTRTCCAPDSGQRAVEADAHVSLPPYEIIIVDDCSADDTVEVVRRWIASKINTPANKKSSLSVWGGCPHPPSGTQADGDIRPTPESEAPAPSVCGLWSVVSLPVNQGPAGARNRGIQEAQGDWIAFLDADDIWAPDKLALQMKVAEAHPEAVMFCGRPAPFIARVEGAAESETRHGRWGAEGDRVVTLAELSEHNPIATSTVVVKRDVLERVGGFDLQFRGPEDYDLWLRLAAQGAIYYSSAILSRYRYGDLSLSTDDRTFLAQVVRVVNKAYAPGGPLQGMKGRRRALSYQHLAASWMAAERGSFARAWLLWGRAFWLWPFRYGPHSRLPWGRLKLAVRLVRHPLRGCRLLVNS